MITGQQFALLAAAGCYAAATVLSLPAVSDEKKRRPAFVTVAVAFLAHGSALALRAAEAGRLPALGLYEVTLGYTWLAALVFFGLLAFKPYLYAAGLAALPLLAAGTAMAFFIKEAPPLTEPHFYSFWFYSHTLTAYLAFGLILCGTALGVALLLKERAKEGSPLYKALPPLSVADFLSWRLLGLGFFFLGLMIVSGALWANRAWGRYWGWDPIETWSLISWLLYAILLHLRRLHGWYGGKAAFFQAGAFLVLVFALFAIGLIYTTIHRAYF